MSRPRRRLCPAAAARPAEEAGASFTAIRAELEVPEAFPDAVLAEAAAAARAGPRDDVPGGPERAVRDLPFVTLDPPGSRDLDQAFHLERSAGGGWRVRYAIARAEQEVIAAGGSGSGSGWTLSLRGPLAVERHNGPRTLRRRRPRAGRGG